MVLTQPEIDSFIRCNGVDSFCNLWCITLECNLSILLLHAETVDEDRIKSGLGIDRARWGCGGNSEKDVFVVRVLASMSLVSGLLVSPRVLREEQLKLLGTSFVGVSTIVRSIPVPVPCVVVPPPAVGPFSLLGMRSGDK